LACLGLAWLRLASLGLASLGFAWLVSASLAFSWLYCRKLDGLLIERMQSINGNNPADFLHF